MTEDTKLVYNIGKTIGTEDTLREVVRLTDEILAKFVPGNDADAAEYTDVWNELHNEFNFMLHAAETERNKITKID